MCFNYVMDKKYVLRVKDLANEKRPREKLITYGPNVLNSPELLAIILGVGTKKEEVLSMSDRILKEYGERSLIAQIDPKIVAKEFDIPIVKACQVVACFELGRRFFKEKKGALKIVRTARQAFEYFKDIGKMQKEFFCGIYLNSRYQVIHDEVIAIGSLTSNIIHPREVFKPAIEHSAAALIVAHNHPSGDIKPSRSDIETTKQLAEASRLLNIELLDHLIVAKEKFVSIPFTGE
jgi:DNA repair protein RadC